MDVTAWLRSLGMQRYEPAFREHAIDADVLCNLTVDDLKELGVTSVGHRRKLLDALAELFPAVVPSVECDLSRKLRRKIESNELDLAILTQDVDIDSGLPLWEERLVWAEPAQAEQVADTYTAVGLLDVDCVVRDMTLRLAAQHAPLHRIAFRSSNLSSIVSAVENGFCASLLPQSSLSPAAS